MSDGSLSQEEIDALLQGADDIGVTPEPTPDTGQVPPSGGGAGFGNEEIEELKALGKELGKIMGTTLATITGKGLTISSSSVDLLNRDSLLSQISENVVQIGANFTGTVAGHHSFIVPQDLAKKIAAMMMAQEEGELTEMALSALNEAFSQMTGAVLNVIEDLTTVQVKTGPPSATQRTSASELEIPEGDFVRFRYEFESEGFKSLIEEIFALDVAKALADGMLQKKGVNPAAAQQGTQQQQPQAFSPGIQTADVYSGTAQTSQPQAGGVGVQPVQFAPLSQPQGQTTVPGNIGLLMDVSMQLTVELGRTKMLIKDILGMGEGTIVELDKLAGEPVDLLVNGKLIAKGEVVVIDENFGVRVTDIISPMERISNLE